MDRADGTGLIPVPPTSDGSGVRVGWRVWFVEETRRPDDRGGPTVPEFALGSATGPPSCPWPALSPLHAECRVGRRHEAPARNCQCGVWALRDLAKLSGALPPGHVAGCVATWGATIDEPDHWRAAQGYPCVLFAPPSIPPAACEQLSVAYGVPVHRVPAGLWALIGEDRDSSLRNAAEAVRRALVDRLATGGEIPVDGLLTAASRIAWGGPVRARLWRARHWLSETVSLLVTFVGVALASPKDLRTHGLPWLPANRRMTEFIEDTYHGKLLELVPRHQWPGYVDTQGSRWRARWRP